MDIQMLNINTGTNPSTHPRREGRPNNIPTDGYTAPRRASNKTPQDAQRDDIRLIQYNVHVLVDNSSILEIQHD